MTCELIAFGIPVITSDIAICRDLFATAPNVRLIPNDTLADIVKISAQLQTGLPYTKAETFFSKNTIQKEVDLLTAPSIH